MKLILQPDGTFTFDRSHFAVKAGRMESIILESLPEQGALYFDAAPVLEVGTKISALDMLIGLFTYRGQAETVSFSYQAHGTNGRSENGLIELVGAGSQRGAPGRAVHPLKEQPSAYPGPCHKEQCVEQGSPNHQSLLEPAPHHKKHTGSIAQ